MKSVAIVLGTYNRLPLLQRAIASIRASVGAHPYQIVVCDGGSTDGTREYLAQRHVDCAYLSGGLEGAVRAFNAGFAWAVEHAFDYVMHLNDDAEIDHSNVTYPIAQAIDVMNEDAKIGEVAFALDLRGDWGFEYINGVPYANFGIVRREAGMAVAREQGDPDGRAWWNPIYRTYGADCEFGMNLWRLGWTIYTARPLRVHDMNHQDELRQGNTKNNKNGDSDLFWSRWRDVDMSAYATPEPLRVPATQFAQRRRGRGPNSEYRK